MRCSRRRWLEKLRRSAQSATSLDATSAVLGIRHAGAAQLILSPEHSTRFRGLSNRHQALALHADWRMIIFTTGGISGLERPRRVDRRRGLSVCLKAYGGLRRPLVVPAEPRRCRRLRSVGRAQRTGPCALGHGRHAHELLTPTPVGDVECERLAHSGRGSLSSETSGSSGFASRVTKAPVFDRCAGHQRGG
jgi:hypothetical protein